jgi:hypothetical protein
MSTVPHSDPHLHINYDAWLDLHHAQDWFRPTGSFFNNISPALSLTLSLDDADPIESYQALHFGDFHFGNSPHRPLSPPGNHEAASRFVPLAPHSSSPVPPSPFLQPTASSPHLSDAQVSHHLAMGTSESFLFLFQHDYIVTVVLSGFHGIECPQCSLRVKTSIPGTVQLCTSGQFSALANHYCKKPCLTALARKEQAASSALIQEITSPTLSRRSLTPALTPSLSRTSTLDSFM